MQASCWVKQESTNLAASASYMGATLSPLTSLCFSMSDTAKVRPQSVVCMGIVIACISLPLPRRLTRDSELAYVMAAFYALPL